MDIRMPVMDGVEAARIIKQLRPALPIVAHTANNLEEEPANTKAYGCDEYLAKPFKPQLLHSIINKYLN
jgi:CheY-like chemotaxis protein